MKINSTSIKNTSQITLYWTCQLLGWGTVALYWAYTVYTRDNYGVFYTVLNYALDVTIGIALTHGYRDVAFKNHWRELPIKKLLVRVIPSVLILSILYVLICNLKWYGYWTLVVGESKDLKAALLYWDPILLTGLRLFSIWILAYHLYHYYIKELATAKENAQLSLIAKQIELDNLSAQLNPHFLFNALNSIKSLVIENPNTARRAIDLLSDLLRSSLYEKDKDLIPIKEELALVNDYVEIEKLRFEERLELKISVKEELENFKIPTLSIQLLVENAIKHGIDKRIDGGLVQVIIFKKEELVYIQVKNPGILVLNTSQKRVGLKNLTKRLEIQYKKEASFHLVQSDTNTVEATITLPFNTHENI